MKLDFDSISASDSTSILEIRHSKQINFTVIIVNCGNFKPKSSTGNILIGSGEIAKQNAEKNLPTFKEFIQNFHNLSMPQYDNDSAVVRYSCLDCDFPKMDQICPEVENRKGIHLRVEYNGYKNTTVDGKPCLNWMQVRPTRNLRTKTFIRKSSGPWRPDKGDIKTG